MDIIDYKKSFSKLLEEVPLLNEKNKVTKAFHFAEDAHRDQLRKSGSPYITHPLAVAISLWDKFHNIDLLIAGLLHDTVEDCEKVDRKAIYNCFGNEIGFMVDAVTKTEKNFFNNDQIFEDERDKILYGGMKNIGCILIKLADREHNLATLGHLTKHKQIRKSFESQALYLPLMNILEYNKTNIDLETSANNLKKYLQKQNIQTGKQLKKNLLNTCFHNFSEEIFDVVYNNSNHVIWEITDKNVFTSLVDSGWFDSDAVEIKKIETNGIGKFTVYFIFKSGSIFDLKSGKISMMSSNFISNN